MNADVVENDVQDDPTVLATSSRRMSYGLMIGVGFFGLLLSAVCGLCWFYAGFALWQIIVVTMVSVLLVSLTVYDRWDDFTGKSFTIFDVISVVIALILPWFVFLGSGFDFRSLSSPGVLDG